MVLWNLFALSVYLWALHLRQIRWRFANISVIPATPYNLQHALLLLLTGVVSGRIWHAARQVGSSGGYRRYASVVLRVVHYFLFCVSCSILNVWLTQVHGWWPLLFQRRQKHPFSAAARKTEHWNGLFWFGLVARQNRCCKDLSVPVQIGVAEVVSCWLSRDIALVYGHIQRLL